MPRAASTYTAIVLTTLIASCTAFSDPTDHRSSPPDMAPDTASTADTSEGPACGDGVTQGAESCDDGNTLAGDGCSPQCLIEQGFRCDDEGCEAICGDGLSTSVELCDDGNTNANDGCSPTCTREEGFECNVAGTVCQSICGDGLTRGLEGCDDGDEVEGDGCDAECELEVGFDCDVSMEATRCQPRCGDARVVGDEACDDGNTTPGDGCDEACQVEAFFTCSNAQLPSTCQGICGDGQTVGQETCDDGNTTHNDGCGDDCRITNGYRCEPRDGLSFCVPVGCGDGVIDDPFEQCDDGDEASDDGCSARCLLEEGFNCTASAPTVCLPTCGDALLKGVEVCDDGNFNNGDGCPSTCDAVEPGFICETLGAPCETVCGDGLVISGLADDTQNEACDDGNTEGGDYCSADCRELLGACGDNVVQSIEACDDGNTDNGDGCANDCSCADCLPASVISAGLEHSCAIVPGGGVYCWGSVGPVNASPQSGTFTQLVSGDEYSCGLKTDQRVQCWGPAFRDFLSAEQPSETLVQISAPPFLFADHACAITTAGDLICWGASNIASEPVPDVGPFVEVSAGLNHVCGLDSARHSRATARPMISRPSCWPLQPAPSSQAFM